MGNIEEKETLEDLFETYYGVDWDTITMAITYNRRAYLFKFSDMMARIKIPKLLNKHVTDWTHNEDVIVISLED